MTKSHFSAITLFCKQKSDQWSDLFPVRNTRSFMKQFGRAIVKLRYIILAVAIALLIPSAIGYMHTKINYDMLVYLPQDIDTMKGQDILKDEFGTGAFASYIVKGMSEKQVSDLKAERCRMSRKFSGMIRSWTCPCRCRCCRMTSTKPSTAATRQ